MKNWKPTAEISTLRRRSEILDTVRSHFKETGCLEVETPLLADSCAGHPEQALLEVNTTRCGKTLPMKQFLQASPEHSMKRLLAAGSGDIYQVCKAFRDDNVDINHNPEFTILEWYRVGATYTDIMSEVEKIVARVLERELVIRRVTFRELICECTGQDPVTDGVWRMNLSQAGQGVIDLNEPASYH